MIRRRYLLSLSRNRTDRKGRVCRVRKRIQRPMFSKGSGSLSLFHFKSLSINRTRTSCLGWKLSNISLRPLRWLNVETQHALHSPNFCHALASEKNRELCRALLSYRIAANYETCWLLASGHKNFRAPHFIPLNFSIIFGSPFEISVRLSHQ